VVAFSSIKRCSKAEGEGASKGFIERVLAGAPSPIRDRFVSIPSEIPVSVKNDYALRKLGCYLVSIQGRERDRVTVTLLKRCEWNTCTERALTFGMEEGVSRQNGHT
jgi:hypothetical protein